MTKIEYHTMKMHQKTMNQVVHQSAGTILEIFEIFHLVFVFRRSNVSLYDHWKSENILEEGKQENSNSSNIQFWSTSNKWHIRSSNFEHLKSRYHNVKVVLPDIMRKFVLFFVLTKRSFHNEFEKKTKIGHKSTLNVKNVSKDLHRNWEAYLMVIFNDL